MRTDHRTRINFRTPRVDVRENVPHVADPGDPIRDQNRQVAPGEMDVHIPQPGNKKLPSAGNGARTLGEDDFGIPRDDFLNAVPNDDHRLVPLGR